MFPPTPTSNQPLGALCAEHTDRPATLICTRCGSYACDACRRVGAAQRDYCFRCNPAQMEPLAEPGTRFAAELVDRLSVILPYLVLSIMGGVVGGARGEEGTGLVLPFVGLGVVGSLGMMGYQLYLLATSGQSLGKRLMGIKVVRTNGSAVDLGRLILLRNVVPGFINLITCSLFGLVDPLFIFATDRRCLHDHVADTKVVKVSGPSHG